MTSLKQIITTLLLSISFLFRQGQEADEGLVFQDHIYLPQIRTVTFNPIHNPYSYPILTLNNRDQLNIDTLILGFDDLSGEINRYVYTVQLCDKNWEPIDLATAQYIIGFENEPINTYEPSSATITPFIHYDLQIPNPEFSLKLSGNYLLKVYEDEDDRRLAFTKRFLVVKPQFKLIGQIVPTFDIDKRETHHEIDFMIDHENQTINNAVATVSATILQNDRWDTAIENMPPLFLKNEKMIFDYSDKIIFDALREFRQFDNRSFNDRSFEVQKIERFSDGYLVRTKPTEQRKFTIYNHRGQDLNGKFIIQNRDEFPDEDYLNYEFRQKSFPVVSYISPYYFLDPINNILGDYSINQFYLNFPEEIKGASVYIYGGLSNYEFEEEFKMKYNPEKSRYEGSVLLKQGFYEYLYAVVSDKDQEVDFQTMESNLFETENNYTILVYYTPFGSQYDQLVSIHTINSRLRQ